MKWGKNLIGLVVVVIFGLSLILVPLASQVSPAQAAVTWTYPVEVTLRYPVTLENENYVVDACVIKESSTSYKMWYTHGKTDLSISDIVDVIKALNLGNIVSDIGNLDLAQFLNDLDDLTGDVSNIVDLLDGTRTVIGYATSTNGRTWTVQRSEVAGLTGSSAAWNSVGAPCVIWDATANKYKMWYTHPNTDLTQPKLQTILNNIASTNTTTRKNGILDLMDSISTVIGYATSDNGADWTVQGSQVLPVSSIDVWSSVADPCVIWDATDSKYKMWYTRAETDLTQADLDTILTNIGTFGIDDLLDILDGTSTVIEYTTSSNGIDWGVPQQVLPVSSVVGAWDSVANPSVVKTGSSYEMWYTSAKTDLLEANLHTLASEIKGLGISTLWNSLKTKSLADFIADLVALDIDDIKALLDGTRTVIGYATWDGVSANWAVQATPDLVGSSDSPWSSVAAPSVVKTGSAYEMWYTEGIGDLTWQNLLDLAFGDNLPIGYAYYSPAPLLPPLPPPGITDVSGVVTGEGVFTEDVTAESEDGKVELFVEEGTTGLTEEGEPLSEISIIEMEEPPDPPEDSNVIGLVYDLGPSGADFDPFDEGITITICLTYDESEIPEDVAEENLVTAMWDDEVWNEETGEWGAWVNLDSVVDPETNTICAEISHFTVFTILAYTRPAAFVTSDLSITPAAVDVGEEVTISLLITNTGDLTGTYEASLKIDDVVVATKDVTLVGGASQGVTFTTAKDVAGTYSVDVSGLTGSFTVKIAPAPAPAAFTSSNLSITPAEIDIGEEVTISALITNTGDLTGSYEASLKIDNVVVATKEVTLAGGASQKVTFTISKDVAGTYSVDVSGLTGSFTVREEVAPVIPKPINWWLIGGIIGGVIIIGLVVWLVITRRRA